MDRGPGSKDGPKFACITRNWNRSPRQGSAEGDSEEYYDDPRGRTRHRKIGSDGRTLLQHFEETERTLHLCKLRRPAHRCGTGHGRLRLGPDTLPRLRTTEISRLLLVSNGT